MILLFPKRNSALVSFRTTSLFCYPVSFEPICSENGMKDILCYMTTHLPDCILSENCILDIATNYGLVILFTAYDIELDCRKIYHIKQLRNK